MFRTKSNGFSLVELMIVVAIMAILAAIAIPSFMRFSMRAKTAEATMNIAAIRTCLESYRAENDVYLACPLNPGGWAAGSGASTPQAWDTSAAWDTIGFTPDGNVRYQYSVVADATTFTILATGDLDEDGTTLAFQLSTGDADYPRPTKVGTGY